MTLGQERGRGKEKKEMGSGWNKREGRGEGTERESWDKDVVSVVRWKSEVDAKLEEHMG